MSDETEFPPPLPEVTPDLRAAWWSWPVIVASLVFIAWGVNFLPPVAAPNAGNGEAKTRVAGVADLAILKIQSQLVIASDSLDPKSAKTALADLRTQAFDDHSVAAVALLESFVAGEVETENETLAKKRTDSRSDVIQLTRKAVAEGIDAEERGTLHTYLGWFAELAPGPESEEAPRAEKIRKDAFVALVVGGLMLIVGGVALVAGVVLLFLHVHRWLAGAAVNRFDPALTPGGIMLECFALYLGLMVLGELGGGFLDPSIQFVGYAASVIVPLLWPMVRGVRWHDFRMALGLHSGAGWLREIGAGIVGYLGMLSVASVGIFLTLILTFGLAYFSGDGGSEVVGDARPGHAPIAPQTHPIVGWIYAGDWKARLMCLLLAAGFAPLFEEIFFRGAMNRYLRGKMKFFWAALVSSLIFAALHPQGLVGIPALAAIGIGLSLIREWRDSLIAPMVAHAINNGLLVGFLWLAL